jgi:hypothetical protein
MVRAKPEEPGVPVGGMQTMRMKSTMATKYFVYCMTTPARPRLFGDSGMMPA